MNRRVKAGTSRASAAHRRSMFVEAYLQNGGNATEAAKAAGFSEKRARATGAELVADRNIQRMIQRRRDKLQESSELKTERILREIAAIAFFDVRELFREDGSLKSPTEWPPHVAASVASIEVVEMAGGAAVSEEGGVRHVPMYVKKIKIWDKNSALEKAMKHLGLFEKDNTQRGALDGLPRELVQLIADRLRGSLEGDRQTERLWRN